MCDCATRTPANRTLGAAYRRSVLRSRRRADTLTAASAPHRDREFLSVRPRSPPATRSNRWNFVTVAVVAVQFLREFIEQHAYEHVDGRRDALSAEIKEVIKGHECLASHLR